jgi:predicted GH43/DUF377 family glycosyl hydrolase
MVKTLGKYAIEILPPAVQDYLDQFKHCFNPSIVFKGAHTYMAVRVVYTSNTIDSIIMTWDAEGQWQTINLSETCLKESGLEKVADPKLFKLGTEVYCTFNTGYTSTTNNKIFLGSIDHFDRINFKECILEKRQGVEKNWAFFEKNGQLHALYSIQPMLVLVAESDDENKIYFKLKLQKSSDLPNYSIGTPLVLLGDSSYLFIVHKKLIFLEKRAYFGVPMIFDSLKMELVPAKSRYLIHSLISLLGSKKKFNTNLISCTYFSGIIVDDEDVILSYGINDLNMGIIKVPKKMMI